MIPSQVGTSIGHTQGVSDDLDTAARAFAAADAFERNAAELRAELRRLRAAGRTAPSWGPRRELRAALPDALPRIAAEAAFLIAAAVFVGVAGYGAAAVVVTMAVAWLVVLGIESALLRARRETPEPPVDEPAYDGEAFLEALRPSPSARSRSSSALR